MIREMLAHLIDDIDDFLEEKNVVIENEEKLESECPAVIYGSDYDDIESRLSSTLKASGIYVSNVYGETVTQYDNTDLVIFVPAKGAIIKIEEGTGDNLLGEDRKLGYIDYINWTSYEPMEIGYDNEIDGGMLMLTKLVSEKYESMIDAVPEILNQAYDNDNLSFIVLSGGKPFRQ